MDVTPDASLVVFPEPMEAEDPAERRNARENAGAAAPSGRGGESIRGARDHMPADPFRDIHWKASARMGKWMVKERESGRAAVVDIRLPAEFSSHDFERIVSRACAFVLACEKEGRPYRIWEGDSLRIDAAGGSMRTEALTFLAMAGAEEPSAERGTP